MAVFALVIAASFSLGSRAALLIEPGALTALRLLLASMVMAGASLIAMPKKNWGQMVRPKAFWRFILLGGLMGLYFITMFEALKTTNPVSTGAIFTLLPLFTTAIAFFLLQQSAKPVVLISLTIAAAGSVWVIFRGDVDAILKFNLGRGEYIFLAGTFAHALYAALVRRLNRGEPVMLFSFWTLVGATLAVTPYALGEIMATRWLALPLFVWLTIAYLATVTTAGTFFLLQYAVVRIPAAKATAYVLLTPCYIILLEGIVGVGWAPVGVILGALVTILGLAILIRAPDV